MRIPLHLALAGAALLACLALGAASSDVRASTVERLDLAQLFDRSEHVVHGRVARVSVVLGSTGRPETEHELVLASTFWGQATGSLVFRTPGGALPDGRELVIPGLPRLAVGEEVLLFLTHESKRGLRLPVGLAQGKYQVVRDAHGPTTLVRGSSDLLVIEPATGRPAPLATAAALGWDATVRELERLARERRAREAAERK